MSSIPTHECSRYLTALFARASRDAFIEVRTRTLYGMRSTFFHARDIAAAQTEVARVASKTDVYVGVLPRCRRGGTRADVVAQAAVLWIDCDTPASRRALAEFVPGPTITVASGSRGNRHAYWLLSEPVSLDKLAIANRALAKQLGADRQCADVARVLRPPSWNHKHDPPHRARLLSCSRSRTYSLEEVVAIRDEDARCEPTHVARNVVRHFDDPLLALDPARYVEELAALVVPRNRKVCCPFHHDDTPSLHVYEEARDGWYCYGCGRGGSIYDFAAALWNITPRGAQFLELRDRLDARFDHRDLPPAREDGS